MKNCKVCSVVSELLLEGEVFRQMNETIQKKQQSMMAQEKPVNDILKLIKNRKKKICLWFIARSRAKRPSKDKKGLFGHLLSYFNSTNRMRLQLVYFRSRRDMRFVSRPRML